MENEFSTWLTTEMNRRGWSNSELARRAEIVPSAISMVISGHRGPGLDLCVGLSRAFKIPPEDVLRKAGLLPPLPLPDDPTLQELFAYCKRLSPQARKEILEYVLFRYQRQESQRDGVTSMANSDGTSTAPA